jgi:alkylated DNA repair dioxygenase AlkB
VTIVRVTRVTVTPGSVSMKPGESQQFTATVQGFGNPAQGIDWIVDPDPWDWESTSTITADGTLYVAEGESVPRLRVKAVSWEDRRVIGYATVTVTHTDDPPKFPPLIAN